MKGGGKMKYREESFERKGKWRKRTVEGNLKGPDYFFCRVKVC